MFLDGMTIEHQVKHKNITDVFLLQGVPTKHLPNLKKKLCCRDQSVLLV